MTEDIKHNGSQDSDNYNSDHIEDQPPAAKAGFGTKLKRHFKRFWWVHLIIFCIVFLIIALCLVYVGLPNIAQDDVDASSIALLEMKFLEPTADSMSLSQNGSIHSGSTFTPTLDAFNVSLYVVTDGQYSADRMLYYTLPSVHVKKGNREVDFVNQTVFLESQEQIALYTTQVLTSENITTALVGKTDLHLGALPSTNIHYNKTTTYKGLNGLKGFNTTDVKINLTAPAGTPNLEGIAFIPNPSVMTIAMGNVTLSLSTDTEGIVGNATINDLTLVPGDNHFPLYAIVNQTLVLASLNSSGFVDMHIIGNSSVYNGQHLTYYEKALSSNPLTLTMNINQIIRESLPAANSTS